MPEGSGRKCQRADRGDGFRTPILETADGRRDDPHPENQISILDRNVQGGNMRQCPEFRGLSVTLSCFHRSPNKHEHWSVHKVDPLQGELWQHPRVT